MTSEQNEMVLDTVHYDALNADIRILIDGEHNLWFVASDLAKTLEYKDARHMTRGLDDEEQSLHKVERFGGQGAVDTTIVTEAGLYQCILNSKSDRVKPFKHWLTHEVLPQIRKTGHYAPTHRTPSAKENRETLSAELDVAERLGRTFSKGVQQAYLLEQDQKYYDENSIHFLPSLAIHEATMELEKAHITFDRSENTLMAARIPVADFPTVNVGELAKIYNHPKITTTLINRWLCEDGYQKRISKRKFAKTSLSKDIATEKLALTGDTKGKKYINGWKKTNELMDLLNKHVDEFLGG
jgi:prophage antirepressor-like protein